MADILNQLAAHARERVAAAEQKLSKEALQDRALSLPADTGRQTGFPFERALSRPDGDIAFLCECKKASPSKGLIAPEFPYLQIAEEYAAAGADAISCLTEPKWFKGDIDYLRKVASEVTIPVLRKDFIIDECQIEEAALAGASAVLLISAILKDEEIKDFMKRAKDLGLDVLSEAHDEMEMERMLKAGANIVGVNNRDLRDFTIHMETTERLAKMVPKDVLLVSESGMTDEKAVHRMRQAGADAVLIGEMLMRAEDRSGLLQKMIQENS